MDEIARSIVNVTGETRCHVTRCLETVSVNPDGLDVIVQKVNGLFCKLCGSGLRAIVRVKK